MSQVFEHAWPWVFGPIGALLALIAAFAFSRNVMARSEGEPDMVAIARAVREGAMAYLARQYRIVAIVFAILVAILLVMGLMRVQPIWSALGVPIAGFLSGLCGWFGMKMATNASARTTFAAKHSLDDGLRVAFRAGAVMGLVVVGFALLDVSVWFLLWRTVLPGGGDLVSMTTIMLSYGMGASTQALFARVGGGIFTKAADVGADLVGKVEAGIPEDDARNPATIADNVGDNVGDVAGMGADLYESYYGSILAAMALGAAAAARMGDEPGRSDSTGLALVVAPIALAGIGILSSLAGIFIVRAREDASFGALLKSLNRGVWGASALVIALSLGLFWVLFRNVEGVSWLGLWGAIVTGLVAGLVIARATEHYTSYEHGPTRSIAEQAQTGPGTVIIAGIATGMISTWVPIVTVVVAIIVAFICAGGGEIYLLGLYGVGIAAVGMLSTLGITLATDAYGPIADNAGGNAQMTNQPAFVRERTDMLDSLGNTTAATGKGFAIGSAALTALALLAAYVSVVQTCLDRQLTEDVDGAALVARYPTSAYVAQYAGHGRFSVADRSKGTIFGAFVSDRVLAARLDEVWVTGDRRFPFEGPFDARANVGRVSVRPGGGDVVHFDLVRADRATIPQVLAFFDVNLMNPRVIGGLFLGALLANVFCAMTMSAVGRAAYRMMNECRRQFGLMREALKKQGWKAQEIADPTKWPARIEAGGVQYPDYARCVAISTAGAQREMIVPSLLAIVVPVGVGLVLGVGGVMGLLAGGLTTGFAIAIFMANAGGAWDNAKKYVEQGHYGGKGSSTHKAAVVGDTVGDPFKDTAGPSLNILIKLIAIVSVVFAGLVVRYSPAFEAMLGLG